jgi:hypothetical protein
MGRLVSLLTLSYADLRYEVAKCQRFASSVITQLPVRHLYNESNNNLRPGY